MNELKWIEIDLSAIRHNVKWVRSRLSPGVKLMAVVKADAYGHGASGVSREVLKAGADILGVLTTAEAHALRTARISAPIHVLSPVLPHAAPQAVRLKTTATIDSVDQARALDAAAGRGRFGVHIDLDFGLGRWGIPAKNLPDFLSALSRFKRVRLEGLSTHVDYVPGKNTIEAEQKLRAFAKLGQGLKARHPGLVIHAANSSVLMDFPHWQFDPVRVGNLLYGIQRREIRKEAPLQRPFKLQARIIALHDVVRGQSIGYASEYIAARAMRVATLPVGYADGLTMEPAERLISLAGFQYWGLLRGIKTPFIGRCGISHVLVDVTAARGAKVGDVVTLPVRRTAASSHIPRRYA